jgi:hypothetical protein
VIHAATVGLLEPPQLDTELVHAASTRLLTEDLPIAAMLLSATTVPDIAVTLDLSAHEVRRRALRIIGRLQAAEPGPEVRRAQSARRFADEAPALRPRSAGWRLHADEVMDADNELYDAACSFSPRRSA